LQNLRGILLVLFAMAAFAIEDALVKLMTATMPVGQTLAAVGLGGMVAFFVAAGPGGRAWIVRALKEKQVLWRTGAEAISAVSFVTALSLIPLSTVAAVFQATPLAVTAGAAIFMGERVGWRRWTAVVVGFLGVLIIIRPGMEGFRPETVFVLVSVATIALRDLVTRRVPAVVPSVAVAFHGFAAATLAGLVLLAVGPAPMRPESVDLVRLGFAIVAATTGYYAIVAAMRGADASALMPFRYSRLVFSLSIGMLVFAERPDALTLTGAGVIIAAAFYTYLRERKIALTPTPAE